MRPKHRKNHVECCFGQQKHMAAKLPGLSAADHQNRLCLGPVLMFAYARFRSKRPRLFWPAFESVSLTRDCVFLRLRCLSECVPWTRWASPERPLRHLKKNHPGNILASDPENLRPCEGQRLTPGNRHGTDIVKKPSGCGRLQNICFCYDTGRNYYEVIPRVNIFCSIL